MFNKDQPAAPCIVDVCEVVLSGDRNKEQWTKEQMYGLTKREMFAMEAMKAIISNQSLIDSINDKSIEYIKESSYKIADSMVDEDYE